MRRCSTRLFIEQERKASECRPDDKRVCRLACTAGAKVGDPSRCVMGCSLGTAISGWVCRLFRLASRSCRRLRQRQQPLVTATSTNARMDTWME
jgi:hypothetical protein